MPREGLRMPVLLNGEGDYVRENSSLQPLDYNRSKKINIPDGCFVAMVTAYEFQRLVQSEIRMMADGRIIERKFNLSV